MMRRVVIESPFAGNEEENLTYVRACMSDCLKRGESPYASHALYTQPGVLNDKIPEERVLGIEAGFEWGDLGHLRVIYIDYGMSSGMEKGIRRAKKIGQVIEFRSLDKTLDSLELQKMWEDRTKDLNP